MAWTFPTVDKPTPSSATQRVHWLTVHRGARLTLDSVYAHGVHADGCHSTLDDDGAVITYIHLSSRCRLNAIAKSLAAHVSARVVDAATEKMIVATREFQTLVRHLNGQGKHVFSDGVVFGLLTKHCQHIPAATRPPSRLDDENEKLRARIASMEKGFLDLEHRLQTALTDCTKAEDEIGVLRKALSAADGEREERESELKRLRIENTEFRRLGAEEKEVRRLNRELMTLQDRHEEKVRDCKVLEMTLRIAREDNAKLQAVAALAPRPGNYLKK
jgi:DNA repair exonuclease SbcCD ATPase subunit